MKRAKATLVCFWDYDTQWGADRSRGKGGPKTWGHLDFEHTEELLEIHAKFSLPACFAVVGAAALPGGRPYHDPAQIRRVHAAGHEIASHSFRHEWLPGLGPSDLRETVRLSKAALEDCTGSAVISFVPPFNQPFDYARRLSISLSERRAASNGIRVDVGRLCEELKEAGYAFCRLSYRPLPTRVIERVLGRELNRPARPENIAGITCLRTNTPGGFDARAARVLERCAERGGVVTAWGHPHSLHSGGSQDRRHLLAFFATADRLKHSGKLEFALPSQFTSVRSGRAAATC